jgi:hypothetical protein
VLDCWYTHVITGRSAKSAKSERVSANSARISARSAKISARSARISARISGNCKSEKNEFQIQNSCQYEKYLNFKQERKFSICELCEVLPKPKYSRCPSVVVNGTKGKLFAFQISKYLVMKRVAWADQKDV